MQTIMRSLSLAIALMLLIPLSTYVAGYENEIPHWLVIEDHNGVIVVSISPDLVLADGTPIIMISDEDEALLLFNKGNILLDIAHDIAGIENASATEPITVSYEGPGEILTARTSDNGVILLVTEGEIDLDQLKASLSGLEADSIIVVNVPFSSNICSIGNEAAQDSILHESFLSDVLGEVICYPPVVVIDYTILRNSGHTIEEVVNLLKNGMGFDNFYLFLVEDYFTLAEEHGPDFLGASTGGLPIAGPQTSSSAVAPSPRGDELGTDESGWRAEWTYVAIAGGGVGAFLATRLIKRQRAR